MALKLTIKPYETIFINGAEICNSGTNISLAIKNHCRILRESEMVREEDVRSPCSRLAFILQDIVLKENPFEELNELSRLALQIMHMMPFAGPYILEIQHALSEKKTHVAFKKGKALMALEAASLAEVGADHPKAAVI